MDIIQFKKFVTGHHKNLSIISRFNFRSRSRNESVAEHSFFVATYANIIADMMVKRKLDINYEMLNKMALVHDAEEAIVGDILSATKLQFKDQYDKISAGVVDELLYDYAVYWNTYSLPNDSFRLEHDIIKLADKISGINFCFEQLEMGNKLFIDILKEYKGVILNIKLRRPEFSGIINLFIIEIDKVILDAS